MHPLLMSLTVTATHQSRIRRLERRARARL